MNGFPAQLAKFLQEVADVEARLIEEACELGIQLGAYGVAVNRAISGGSVHISVGLDPNVPYGRIEYRDWQDLSAFEHSFDVAWEQLLSDKPDE
jgi:hypothetical protein